MSNTLGGVNLAQIAQKSLDALVDELPSLKIFATDFSDEVRVSGESITTRVATQPSVGSLATGYAANVQNVTTTAKTVSLGAVTGLVIGFTDSEVSMSSVNLDQIFIKPGVNAVANYFIDSALALITTANFGAAAFTGNAAAFDEDKIADLAKALTDAKVPRRDRSLVINTTYANALMKRDVIKNLYAFRGGAMQEGSLPQLHGFKMVEYTDIPSNSQNLVGFACAPQGIILAGRLPAVPDNFPGEVQVAKDPESGLSIQLRKWYSADDGKLYLSMAIIPGVAVGVAGNLKRLVSA